MFVMADVYTVTFLVIGLLISYPALLVALNLLLPNVTGRAAEKVSDGPFKTFAIGAVITAGLALLILVTAEAGAGPVRALAWLCGLCGLGLIVIGSAGMSRLLGQRLALWSDPVSRLKNLLRGAVVYELAGIMPVVGWFLFLPLMVILSIGAAVAALFTRSVVEEAVVMVTVEE